MDASGGDEVMPGRDPLPMNDQKQLNIRVDAPDLDALRAIACRRSKATGQYVSSASVIRQALREFVERHQGSN